MATAKSIILLLLVVTPVLALTVSISPNYLRIGPSREATIKVEMNTTASGIHNIIVDGPGINYRKSMELLTGQSRSFPFTISIAEPGRYSILATVSYGSEVQTASADIEVISVMGSSSEINATLYELALKLDDLIVRVNALREDKGARAKVGEIEQLLMLANSSYESGRIIDAREKLIEVEKKLVQVGLLVKMAEENELKINLGLLAAGILVVAIGVVMYKFVK